MYFCDGKHEFSATLLQSLVSHYPSEIILSCWFGAQETFHVYNAENSCALLCNILEENMIDFSGFFDE